MTFKAIRVFYDKDTQRSVLVSGNHDSFTQQCSRHERYIEREKAGNMFYIFTAANININTAKSEAWLCVIKQRSSLSPSARIIDLKKYVTHTANIHIFGSLKAGQEAKRPPSLLPPPCKFFTPPSRAPYRSIEVTHKGKPCWGGRTGSGQGGHTASPGAAPPTPPQPGGG